MKKILFLFTTVAFIGCSGDDDSASVMAGTSFSYDSTTFNLMPTQGIIDQRMAEAMTIGEQSYDRSTITIIGLNGTTETATISFDLYHKTGTSLAGSYEIDESLDEMDEFEDFLAANDRACLGWTSAAMRASFSGTFESANNPSGTVTIVENSATNYTVTYSGNFKQYEDGFDFVGNVPCDINVQANVTVQEN